MTPAVHRRPALTLLAVLLLLGGLPVHCLALDRITTVSPARAAELGITVRLTPRPEDVRVQVDFKPTGPNKEFKYAYLDVSRGGKRLVMAYLMPFKPTPDRMYFECYLDPAAVPDATVTVTVWEDPLTGLGYQLRLKEFMAPPAARLPSGRSGAGPVAAGQSAGGVPAGEPPGAAAGPAPAAAPRKAAAEPERGEWKLLLNAAAGRVRSLIGYSRANLVRPVIRRVADDG